MTATPRALLLLTLPLLVLLVGGFGFAAWDIVRYGDQVVDASADAAIVLGAAAWGSRPSPVYRERIVEAISLYKAKRVDWIILTGGTPQAGYPTEAQVGQQFCVSHGVPAAATLLDERSRTTWQNLQGAKALIAGRNIRTVLLVSDPLHMRRATLMAHDLGLHALPAATSSSRFRSSTARGKFLWRETWLYLAYAVLGVKD